jgi:hypothetical protein
MFSDTFQQTADFARLVALVVLTYADPEESRMANVFKELQETNVLGMMILINCIRFKIVAIQVV